MPQALLRAGNAFGVTKKRRLRGAFFVDAGRPVSVAGRFAYAYAGRVWPATSFR